MDKRIKKQGGKFAGFGMIAVAFAGSGAVLLTGCNGDGNGGGPVVPTPTPNGGPVLPSVPVIAPLTPAQAIALFASKTGVNATLQGTPTPVTDVSTALNQAITLQNLVFPIFPTEGSSASVVLRTAQEVGFTAADLANYKQELVNKGRIQVGDSLQNVTFTYQGKTYASVIVLDENGKVKFNSLFDALPPEETQQVAAGTNTALNRSTAINPITGEIKYQLTTTVPFHYDSDNNVRIDTAGVKTQLDREGAFIDLVEGPTTPVVTDGSTAASLQARDASQFQQVQFTFTIAYKPNNGTTSYRIKVTVRIRLRGKTNTGGGGGVSN